MTGELWAALTAPGVVIVAVVWLRRHTPASRWRVYVRIERARGARGRVRSREPDRGPTDRDGSAEA